MPTEMNLPNLGENIETAEVVRILVSVGDAIKKDQPVVELETGKAVLELPSSVDGKVAQIYVKEGETIKVGQKILSIEGGEGKKTVLSAATDAQKKSLEIPREKGIVPSSPLAKKLGRELGVDLSAISGSGPHGLIMAEDVRKEEGKKEEKMVSPVPLSHEAKWGAVERVPMNHVRKQTALHMTQSWSQIPHVTQFHSADITELEKLRSRFQKRAEAAGGKLTLTVIVLKVVASALKVFPKFNASLDLEKGEIIQKKYVHIGVAVDTDRGLLVPVIRDVDKKNILQLSVELSQMAEKARSKKIKLEEMEGGSFSITNLGGMGGTEHFTPLIYSPEVAVLGIGRSTKMPALVEEKLEWRQMLPLSLSYDHRLIDGADAARFLKWIGDAVAQPFLMDLEG